MNIVREKYITELKNRMNNGLIKVITGIRRCGKSYLLFNLFYDYLRESGVAEDCIIRIALDDDKNENLRDYKELSKYIRSQIIDSKKQYYIFLDEVQLAITEEEFRHPERSIKIYTVLNGLMRLKNVDVYVTGSNSKFLSKDVLTEFRGRGDEIHVLPLSFSEYLQGYQGDVYHAWADYIVYGGLPLVLSMKTEGQKSKYLSNLFAETYLKDIIARNKIEKTQELEDLINILASSTGSMTNPTRIDQTFNSVLHSKISINTVINYIDYLKDAFLINEVNRFDVKGRRYIGSPNKYYFEDVGLRNARLNFRQIEENHLMENIIYNELRYRGFNVDVGIVEKRIKDSDGKEVRKQHEVDFVASQGSRKYYIQSAFSMDSAEKELQEKISLRAIDDSFKKIIVVKDVINVRRDENGIVTISLFDFLQNENSLEL
ncbi:MAG: ATP-binding protein [Spirochaetia bacterium]|nr:ATP-binding protein [Spirochaetia bacterium]